MNQVTFSKIVSYVLGFFLVVFIVAGCSYTRNAPLLTNQIEINDSANGNTVTPVP